MAIVIEVLNRGGQVISSHKFDADRICIGRALNADLTLHDPHIDGSHLFIERAPDTHNFYCEDNKSLNGVWLLGSKKPGYGITLSNKTRLQKKRLFYSGQQFMLGRTIIRVFAADHPVVAPLPFSQWEEVGHRLSHWSVWLTAVLAMVLLQSLDAFLNNPTQKNVLQYILPSGYQLLGALAYGGIWAFIGRILRHEGKFATHFSVALLILLVSSALNWVMPVIIYNLKLWWVRDAIETFLSAALVFVAGLMALMYATHLKIVTRVFVALLAPTAMVLTLIISAITRSEFHSSPSYETALVAPVWQWRAAIDEATFINKTQELFNQAPLENAEENE